MVKWLEEIAVTEGESDNFYHFHDNRVLPSHVTEVQAKTEGALTLPYPRILRSVPACCEPYYCALARDRGPGED